MPSHSTSTEKRFDHLFDSLTVPSEQNRHPSSRRLPLLGIFRCWRVSNFRYSSGLDTD